MRETAFNDDSFLGRQKRDLVRGRLGPARCGERLLRRGEPAGWEDRVSASAGGDGIANATSKGSNMSFHCLAMVPQNRGCPPLRRPALESCKKAYSGMLNSYPKRGVLSNRIFCQAAPSLLGPVYRPAEAITGFNPLVMS
jgi:hypothetical protein